MCEGEEEGAKGQRGKAEEEELNAEWPGEDREGAKGPHERKLAALVGYKS